MNTPKLSEAEIRERLAEIPGWSLKTNRLERQFSFESFSEAFAFMTRAAMISEKMNHHPDWTNVYNKVNVSLYSHDCQALSERDFRWAQAVNKIYKA